MTDRDARGGAWDLSLPRAKPRSVTRAFLHRVTGWLSSVAAIPVLKLFLNLAWVSRRLAFELSCKTLGLSFVEDAMGLTDAMVEAVIPENAVVLDLGCGSGRASRKVAGRASRVIGIDRDKHLLNVGREIGLPDNVRLVFGDITHPLPVQVSESAVDVALLIHCLEHIDDVESMLENLHAFAAALVVEVPDFAADVLNRVRYQLDCPWYSDGDHVREYTADSLIAQLGDCDWDVSELWHSNGSIVALAHPRAND